MEKYNKFGESFKVYPVMCWSTATITTVTIANNTIRFLIFLTFYLWHYTTIFLLFWIFCCIWIDLKRTMEERQTTSSTTMYKQINHILKGNTSSVETIFFPSFFSYGLWETSAAIYILEFGWGSATNEIDERTRCTRPLKWRRYYQYIRY